MNKKTEKRILKFAQCKFVVGCMGWAELDSQAVSSCYTLKYYSIPHLKVKGVI